VSKSSLRQRSNGFCVLFVVAILGVAALFLNFAPGHSVPSSQSGHFLSANQPALTGSAGERVKSALAALPLAFEQNQGQFDPQVKYLARGNGYKLSLTSSDAVLSFASPSARVSRPKQLLQQRFPAHIRRAHNRARPSPPGNGASSSTGSASLRMHLVNGNPAAKAEGRDLLSAKTNYFIGNNPLRWHVGVPEYRRVSYSDVYPGVDLVYHGQHNQLEFDFVVAPHAKPENIAMSIAGAQRIETDDRGDLVLSSPDGEVKLHRPVAYQESARGREIVKSRFVVDAENQIRFAVGHYDHGRELVIDPALDYASYLGGNGDDEANGIAIDSSGNYYITGQSDSTGGFPGGTNPSAGGYDSFVLKINSDGSVGYVTFVGGSFDDFGTAVAVTNSSPAMVYVAGITDSVDFPVTSGVIQAKSGNPGNTKCLSPGTTCLTDGFVFELNSSGSVSYSTYLGGSNNDGAFGIATDTSGDAYVTGFTFSSNFPLSSSPLSSTLNPGNTSSTVYEDAFVSVINPTGTQFIYSTFLGGANNDFGSSIAVDSGNNAYVAGTTSSANFPVSTGAYQTGCGTDGNCNANGTLIYSDAFVTKIAAGGSSLSYSTFLGGSSDDGGIAIALDGANNIYVTGVTSYDNTAALSKNDDFPTTHGSFEPSYGNGTSTPSNTFSNGFVSELTPAGSGKSDLVYSSYLGGSNEDAGLGIAADSAGNAYVTGTTLSTDFPLANAFQTSLNGNSDAFYSEVAAAGGSLLYSTYLGGSGDENYDSTDQVPLSAGVVFDPSSDNVYLAGSTSSSSGFPLTSATQPIYGGGAFDAFAAILTSAADFSVGSPGLSPAFVSPGSSATTSVTIASLNSFAASVGLSCTVVSQPASATSPPTCQFSPATVTGGSGKSMLTVSTTGTTSLGAYEIDVVGTGPNTSHAVAVSLNVANISFTLSAATPNAVSPGNSAMSKVTLQSTNYSYAVNLTCNVSGTGSPAPTCGSFSPKSPITPSSSGTSTTLTIATTGSSAALMQPSKFWYAMWLPIAGLSLVGMSFSSAQSRRKKILGLLMIVAVMTALFLMPACGGSSNNSNNGGGNESSCAGCTPAGTYTVTITGTGTDPQQVTQTTTVNLTVN
jgi:hypothetical protein